MNKKSKPQTSHSMPAWKFLLQAFFFVAIAAAIGHGIKEFYHNVNTYGQTLSKTK